MKIATVNVEYDRDAPIDRVLDEDEPLVVSIQQGNRGGLKRKGYRQVVHGEGFEARGVRALVRKDVKVIRVKTMRMTEPWVGPKAGKRHKPREFLVLLCEHRGRRFWVVCVHLPTFNNPEAQKEALDRIESFVNRHDSLPVFVAGDFNREAHQMKALADAVDGEYVAVGKVDGVLCARARHRTVHRRLAPADSKWHGWGVVRYKIG